MRRGAGRWVEIAALAGLVLVSGLLASGCVRRVIRSAPAAAAAPAQPTDFTAHALPIYRLVATPMLIDLPSQLLILQVRLESPDGTSYAFTPRELAIILPDGTHARVFDRPRAFELLRRTTIADADFGYLLRDGHPPGGIAPYSRAAIADMVAGRLLADGLFGSGQALQGYVVVDVGAARTSLEGAVVEVVATRLTDSVPSRATYRLSAPAPSSGAP